MPVMSSNLERRSFRSLLIPAGLIAAGLLGNFLRIPLFFGVDYLLGSIAVLIVLRLYGLRLGTIAAVIAGSYTVVLWNHPYALIILVFEALFVGLLLGRRSENLVLLDTAYWLIIGMPLVALFYGIVQGMNAQATLLVLMKQSVNGISNAVIASLVLEYTPLTRWSPGGLRPYLPSLRLKLFHAMMILAIVPIIAVMLIDSRRELQEMEAAIRGQLESISEEGRMSVASWMERHTLAVRDVADHLRDDRLAPSPRLQDRLGQVKRLLPDLYNMYVADASATTIAFYPPVNERGESTIGLSFADRPYVRELRATHRPVISEVFQGRGGVFTPIVTISVPILKGGRFRGYVLAAVNLDRMSTWLAAFVHPWGAEATLLDRNGAVIATTRRNLRALERYDDLQRVEPSPLGPGIFLIPPADEGLAPMERWRQSSYVMQTDVAEGLGWKLVVETAVAPYREQLYRAYITSFTGVLFVLLAAAGLSTAISRSLVRPMAHLAEMTADLPARLFARQPVGWPEGPVIEINDLMENFRAMTEALNEQFRRIAETNSALTASEAKYRTLFEESRDAVFISTRDGRFVDINPAGVELFGYGSREELLSIDIPADLYARPEDREDLLRQYERGGYVKDFEVTMKKKGGEPVDVMITATAVRDEQGATTLLRGVIRDMTQLKKLEQQLLQAQKMEAVGQLAGGMAHDFNNILTAIVGYGNLMLLRLQDDDGMRAYVEHILTAADRAAGLTHGLLAFSRKQIIARRPVRLNALIGKARGLIGPLIGEDIQLITRLVDDDLTVLADPGQIEQVLMNLAANARDAMPGGGQLTITTSRGAGAGEEGPDAEGCPTGACAVVSVEDSGEGMADDVREHIFEPFYTTKETGKGTGLGLAIVYGIISQHDGRIEVSSAPGKGTRFTITIPLVAGAVAERAGEDDAGAPRGTETILVAEDDGAVREFLRSTLEQHGYRILLAEDGDDAVGMFRSHRDAVKLLISDVIMPRRNGPDAFREIKEISPGMKALFLSGYTADVMKRRALMEEGATVMQKPFSVGRLLRTVRALIDGELPAGRTVRPEP